MLKAELVVPVAATVIEKLVPTQQQLFVLLEGLRATSPPQTKTISSLWGERRGAQRLRVQLTSTVQSMMEVICKDVGCTLCPTERYWCRGELNGTDVYNPTRSN